MVRGRAESEGISRPQGKCQPRSGRETRCVRRMEGITMPESDRRSLGGKNFGLVILL